MKIDSCRKCGQELKVSRSCTVCNEPIEFQCNDCKIVTEEQFHQTCVLTSFNHHLLKTINATV